MPRLQKQRYELFCQGIANGLTQGEAIRKAGYKGRTADNTATKLMKDSEIRGRIDELSQQMLEKSQNHLVFSREWVLEKLKDNLQMAIEERNGAWANRALELIGKEHGLFVDRKEIKHLKDDLAKLSDLELVQELQRSARLLLEDHSEPSPDDDGTENGTENN